MDSSEFRLIVKVVEDEIDHLADIVTPPTSVCLKELKEGSVAGPLQFDPGYNMFSGSRDGCGSGRGLGKLLGRRFERGEFFECLRELLFDDFGCDFFYLLVLKVMIIKDSCVDGGIDEATDMREPFLRDISR